MSPCSARLRADSPPFEKPNEIARRRNLALTYWLKDDPAYYPRLIPNAKEVLRQLKGNDAEMQHMMGTCILATMEGEPSAVKAVRHFERALEIDPKYEAAAAGLAKATAALAAERGESAPPAAAAPVVAEAPAEPAPKAKKAAAAKKPPPAKGKAKGKGKAMEAAPPDGFEWGLTL